MGKHFLTVIDATTCFIQESNIARVARVVEKETTLERLWSLVSHHHSLPT